jgi:hypothetical protein
MMLKLVVFVFLLAFIEAQAQKFLPPPGKQLLILGQDLQAVQEYLQSGKFPPPGGHTVYINFFNVENPSGPYPYGGLGEDTLGRPVADVDWGAGPVNAHTAAFDPLYKNSVLVIGLWMNESKNKFAAVASGQYDQKIIRLGKFITRVSKPVYLRIGYEFEGTWNPSYADPEMYKAVFRRVTKILRGQGVTNFATVWQTSASPLDDMIERKHENIEDWYPGDDVVDWLGLSWFLNPQEKSVASDIQITQQTLADELLAMARSHNKPVMIAESAPQGYDLKKLTKRNISGLWDGNPGENIKAVTAKQTWQQWFKPFFNFIRKNEDVIKAVAYINTNWDAQRMWGFPYRGGYWGNSQIQENDYITKKWNREVRRNNWLHANEDLFNILKQ